MDANVYIDVFWMEQVEVLLNIEKYTPREDFSHVTTDVYPHLHRIYRNASHLRYLITDIRSYIAVLYDMFCHSGQLKNGMESFERILKNNRTKN